MEVKNIVVRLKKMLENEKFPIKISTEIILQNY
jgi:hypothetical protein